MEEKEVFREEMYEKKGKAIKKKIWRKVEMLDLEKISRWRDIFRDDEFER
jgi:hypothetical protein